MSEKICVFCGENKATTKDHVPPKNLFLSVNKSELITVPACDACNRGSSADDEYFRNQLVKHEDIGGHPAANAVAEKYFSSLTRPEAEGLRKGELQNIEFVDVFSPGGIYLGEGGKYTVNHNRLNETVGKTVRGLYWHETGTMLPKTSVVAVFDDDLIKCQPKPVREKVQSMSSRAMVDSPVKIGEVFMYWYRLTEDVPLASVWVLQYFEALPFMALTRPVEDRRKRQS